MAQVDFLEQNKLSFIVFWETKKNDPRPSNGNQKSNKMTLVMHYGIRITTEVYKNWIPIQYNTLLMPSLDEREKTLSTKLPLNRVLNHQRILDSLLRLNLSQFVFVNKVSTTTLLLLLQVYIY